MKKWSHALVVALVSASVFVLFVDCDAQAQPPGIKRLALGVVFQGPREPLEQHFRPLVEYAA
ncbi:MAG TPA: hypothetical protein VFK25_01830, partial [Candidatus Binatia bacterium]|nr:hypothetical protein [Candidatus Binatia bacterium]